MPRRPVQDRPDVTWPRDLHAETHPHGSEGLGGGPGRPVTSSLSRVEFLAAVRVKVLDSDYTSLWD